MSAAPLLTDSSLATKEPGSIVDSRLSSQRRRKAVHTAPRGAIRTAREMGVQYRADCGRWLWPTAAVSGLRVPGDLHPNTCKQCLPVIWGRMAHNAAARQAEL